MKRSIAIVGILCVAASALADKPVPSKDGKWICRTKQKDAELGDWIDGLIRKNNESQESAAKAIASQNTTAHNLELAKGDGIKLAKERDKAILDLAHVLHKLHVAKLIFSGLVTAVVVLACLWLKIPPPALWLALGGGAVIGNGLVWWFM